MNAAASRTRPVRVVIIDDTLDLRELLRLALTRGGMEVVGEAGDGMAGIEVVRLERPDVVLLDLSMPVMDGLEALPSIRELLPDGKIIVLSGFGATQMSERALATGADGYLQKGMPLKEILQYVRDTVEGDAEPARPTPALTVVRPEPAVDRQPSPEVSAWDSLAMAAFELRGPVSVLTGIAESVARGHEGWTDETSRLMSAVVRQARVLDSITTDLLTAAELHRGSIRLDREPVDPVEAVDSVTGYRDLATVGVVVDDDRKVHADPVRLVQILDNLLTNAQKYGRAPFSVVVRPDAERAELVAVDVTDSGDGVPEEFRPRLFHEFARAGGTVAAGTGLGLYVVRSLAEAHGGSAGYAPAAGGGACFTVSLPAV